MVHPAPEHPRPCAKDESHDYTTAVTAEVQSILTAAMALSNAERAELVAILADSVGDDHTQAEIDAAWLSEAKRRLEAVRAGAPVVDSEEVERRLEFMISRRGS
jgi:putative addiction module component (TIGR02574 family)